MRTTIGCGLPRALGFTSAVALSVIGSRTLASGAAAIVNGGGGGAAVGGGALAQLTMMAAAITGPTSQVRCGGMTSLVAGSTLVGATLGLESPELLFVCLRKLLSEQFAKGCFGVLDHIMKLVAVQVPVPQPRRHRQQ